MSGIKGFGIITILLLCMSFFFLSVGNTEESTEDKQFRKEYEKTMIGEMDFPITVISRIDFTNGNSPMYEELKSSYLMADLHRERALLFFCYNELSKEVLEIERIWVNDSTSIVFIQDNETLKENSESFIVFGIDPTMIEGRKSILVTVFFSEGNKLNFLRREFVIYPSYVNIAIDGIKDFYENYSKNGGGVNRDIF